MLATREKVAVASYQQILERAGDDPERARDEHRERAPEHDRDAPEPAAAQHAEDVQTLAQVKKIEMPTTVTRAVATQTTAASKRAGFAVAIILGLIVGVLLAIVSYAAWPAARPRPEPPKPSASP